MAIVWHWAQDEQEIVDFVRAGGVLAYPTEAVYGLGGDPLNESVVEKVLAYKRTRDPAKGLVLVVDDWQRCEAFIEPLSESDRVQMEKFNAQRPTTFIVQAREGVNEGLRDQTTGRIAIRVSSHPVAAGLSRALGRPIISTSANYSGCLPAKSPEEVRSYFADMPVVVGELGGQNRPSRIMDWQSKVLLRD